MNYLKKKIEKKKLISFRFSFQKKIFYVWLGKKFYGIAKVKGVRYFHQYLKESGVV